MALIWATSASAITVTIVPRSTEPTPLTTAGFIELTEGEIDTDAGTGAPTLFSTRGSRSATSVDAGEITTDSARSSGATTATTDAFFPTTFESEPGFFEGSSEFPGSFEFSEDSFGEFGSFGDFGEFGDFSGESGDFGGEAFFSSEEGSGVPRFSGPAQIPSGGSPSAGASGIPGTGWGAGLPSGVIEGPGAGLHGSIRYTGYDQNIRGDRTRSTHVLGTHNRQDGMLSYERSLKNGIQMRAQGSYRQTDDLEVVGDGNRLRFEGQFVEFGRPTDFLVRAGDITPQFSSYTFAKSAEGVHGIKNYETKSGVLQLQVFAARTQRERDPGAFLRTARGARVARVWKIGNDAAHVGIGASRVGVREDLGSIAPEAAASQLGFPMDSVSSLNYFVDTRQGFHFEGEIARSQSEQQTGPGNLVAPAPATRRGGAHRQSIGYTRSGKNITIEHERIEPTFDAIDAAATLDIDRQSIFVSVPINPKVTVTSFFQRVYNDVINQIGRTGENKTYNVAVSSTPFNDSRSKYLVGLNLGAIGTFSKSEATDASTDRFDRDYTFSIANTIRRLTASYSLRTADNVDFLDVNNTRRPNHSNYQIGYDIIGGNNNYWKVSPFVNIGHDHDVNVAARLIDRSNEASVGFNGNYGSRATFTARRDDRVQRNRTSDRLSLVDAYHAEFNYQLHPTRDIKGQVLYVSQTARDSGQQELNEDKLLVSMFRSW